MTTEQHTRNGHPYHLSHDDRDSAMWEVHSRGELCGTVHFHVDELLWGYAMPGEEAVTTCYGWTREDALEELLEQSR